MTPPWKGGGSGNPWPRGFKSHLYLQTKESTCKSYFVARRYLVAAVYTEATAVLQMRSNPSRSADQKKSVIFAKRLTEKWLSGLRHSPAKGAVSQEARRFESFFLHQTWKIGRSGTQPDLNPGPSGRSPGDGSTPLSSSKFGFVAERRRKSIGTSLLTRLTGVRIPPDPPI